MPVPIRAASTAGVVKMEDVGDVDYHMHDIEEDVGGQDGVGDEVDGVDEGDEGSEDSASEEGDASGEDELSEVIEDRILDAIEILRDDDQHNCASELNDAWKIVKRYMEEHAAGVLRKEESAPERRAPRPYSGFVPRKHARTKIPALKRTKRPAGLAPNTGSKQRKKDSGTKTSTTKKSPILVPYKSDPPPAFAKDVILRNLLPYIHGTFTHDEAMEGRIHLEQHGEFVRLSHYKKRDTCLNKTLYPNSTEQGEWVGEPILQRGAKLITKIILGLKTYERYKIVNPACKSLTIDHTMILKTSVENVQDIIKALNIWADEWMYQEEAPEGKNNKLTKGAADRLDAALDLLV
ncbi:hypothetical protein DM02DRAFT_728779 [Periconia macrospinosa]|uniref:Uncharacterized protein n=1 Tax=Periconia macrospinosa TaxID=97972 RepID=A0A2V1DSC7_9PLEO|nr:hypothetical protein DM02DRAFT_728779 [Periconia macrospinosa]